MATAKRLYIIIPIIATILLWSIYMSMQGIWGLFGDYWFMSLTMVFGSFIAGASSEGGGAVAFPVMTLIFEISPGVARNFGLAIQSIGMTAASYLILVRKIKVEYKYLLPVSLGGVLGMLLGTFYLVPIVTAPFAKMLFVSFWLSFGLVLFYVNEVYKREINDALPRFRLSERITIVFVGIIGGAISALLGSGIDIFSFSYVTMRYHLSEKVATPTSVIIMAINSIVGFILHWFVVRDFGVMEFNYWLVCIPVVVFGAPIGAYFINNRTRGFISKFLYLVILVQFIGALLIIKPSGSLLFFSILVFFIGIFLFFGFAWLSKSIKWLR
jgi:uncharacterized membrane protein YfcA